MAFLSQRREVQTANIKCLITYPDQSTGGKQADHVL